MLRFLHSLFPPLPFLRSLQSGLKIGSPKVGLTIGLKTGVGKRFVGFAVISTFVGKVVESVGSGVIVGRFEEFGVPL